MPHIFLEILNFVKVNIFVMDNSIQTKFKIMNLNNLFFLNVENQYLNKMWPYIAMKNSNHLRINSIFQFHSCINNPKIVMCCNSLYLHNCIYRTSFLTKATVDAFCHVNIIACCSSTFICSRFCLYGDCL